MNKEIPSISGLRAVSIFIVLLSHWTRSTNIPSQLKFILEYLDGSIGVRFFFVISGFLITYLLINEQNKNGRIDIKKFYLRRTLRIFPVFYAFLVVIILLKYFDIVNVDALSIVGGFLYIENFKITPFNWLTGHSWSLAVEEQFYLLWPAIFILFRYKFSNQFLIFVLILGAVMRGFYYKYTEASKIFLAPFFMNADLLYLGCFLGFLFYYKKKEVENFIAKISTIHIFVLVAFVIIFTKLEYHPVYDKFFIPFTGTIVACSSGIILLYSILNPATLFFRFLNNSSIVFIGKLSYSLYVWQQLFIGSEHCLIDKRFSFLQLFPQNMLCVFIMALLSYYIIEIPFLNLKKKLSN
ncbi:MAG: acyltransferase [Chitinophagaceae bacterium]|jgi:peptidoglycan/LPS O-acetylase OafA/YrhL